ncbi:MAG: phosphoribosylanthranilate isomerase [bacterium]
MTKTKICGITSVADALLAVDAGADFLGYVLSDSPRRIGYETLAEIVTAVGDRATHVGVFANEADLRQYAHLAGVRLNYYQVYFAVDKTERPLPTCGWIDAVWVDAETKSLSPTNGLLLADFKKSGNEAMSRLLGDLDGALQEKVILAGNLTVDNVGEVVRAYQPYAVDVARGTESEPGVKDEQLVREFIQRVRDASK